MCAVVVLHLQSLISYAGAVLSATEIFLLTSPLPVLHLHSAFVGTLRDRGLTQPNTLAVQWIQDMVSSLQLQFMTSTT